MIFETFVTHGGGFQGGRDKKLNGAFADALTFHLEGRGLENITVRAEKGLAFVPGLIPDVSVETPESAHCLELTYRKGNFLTSENRGTVARYCLEKLHNYARELGLVSAGA